MAAFVLMSRLLTFLIYMWHSLLNAVIMLNGSNVIRTLFINTHNGNIVYDTWFLRGWFTQAWHDVVAKQVYDPERKEFFWIIQRWDTECDVGQCIEAHNALKSSCMMLSFEVGMCDATHEFNKAHFADVFAVHTVITVINCIFRTRYDGPLAIGDLLTDNIRTLDSFERFAQC